MMTKRTGFGGPVSRSRIVTIGAAVLLLLLAALVVTACGGGGGTGGTTATTVGAGGAQVVLKGFAFDPATVTIKAGESVTWTNQDSANHTVVADNGEFKSSDLANGATFTFKFDKAGSYAYSCSVHPSMKATVVVQ